MGKSFDQMTPEEIEQVIKDAENAPIPETFNMIDWEAVAASANISFSIPAADVIEKCKKKAAFERYGNKVADLAGAPDNGTYIVAAHSDVLSSYSMGGNLGDIKGLVANITVMAAELAGVNAVEMAQEIFDAIKEHTEDN